MPTRFHIRDDPPFPSFLARHVLVPLVEMWAATSARLTKLGGPTVIRRQWGRFLGGLLCVAAVLEICQDTLIQFGYLQGFSYKPNLYPFYLSLSISILFIGILLLIGYKKAGLAAIILFVINLSVLYINVGVCA